MKGAHKLKFENTITKIAMDLSNNENYVETKMSDISSSEETPEELMDSPISSSISMEYSRVKPPVNITEPILIPDEHRYTVFPVKYPKIWQMTQLHESSFWFPNDVDFTTDPKDWDALNDNERYFLKHVLAFFAGADGIVMENLTARFSNEIQLPEARAFYAYQIAIENVHSIVYALMIETYIKNAAEKDKLFNAIQSMPVVRSKAQWAQKWIKSSESFALRLVAFAIVEGIFFSGAFCAIYWLNEKKVMPGLGQANSYIARDENLHCMFAILLFTDYIVEKPSEAVIHAIVKDAVAIELEFILKALPCSLIGMNAEMMSKYIEFCADRLVIQLGYNAIYNSKNPFAFMDAICLSSSTDFFGTRSTDYKKAVVNNAQVKKENIQITFHEDF